MGNNQQIPPPNQRQYRDAESDIIAGARNTDQIEGLQENAAETSPDDQQRERGPAVVKVDNGERKTTEETAQD
jgi:hypothetical protein